jgi:hypothetical protein
MPVLDENDTLAEVISGKTCFLMKHAGWNTGLVIRSSLWRGAKEHA